LTAGEDEVNIATVVEMIDAELICRKLPPK
jgi:hypothetical protein